VRAVTGKAGDGWGQLNRNEKKTKRIKREDMTVNRY